MSQENVEVVRRALTAFLVSQPPDAEGVRELLDPDYVVTTNWGVDQTEHHGARGALATLAEMNATWDSWEQEIEHVLDAGDEGVVALMRFRARGRESAVPVDSAWAIVLTLRNGRIVTSRAFLTHDDALKAVGLEE